MVGAFTNYLRNKILDHTLRGTALSVSSGFVGLFAGDPGKAGSTATEVSAAEYARQALTFAAPASGVAANSVEVSFPLSVTAWGDVVHFGILDAATDGNMLYYGSVDIAKYIYARDIVRFEIGDIEITLD